MFLEKIAAGVFGVNCYVISDDETGKAAVVDPGGDADKILELIKDNQFELTHILLTHGHGDHIGAVNELHEKTKAPVYVHEDDLYILKDANINYSARMGGPVVTIDTDVFLKDGEVLTIGNLKLHVLHTPGHSPGGVCIRGEGVVFTGDTLFANSIGRSDLEGGNYDQLIASIQSKLMTLDDELTVLPGHGPASTIGIERMTNPYIK
ncbi:beta-lactamase domain protein [Alkaliphilus metalliredigens QYMF]|uniref:Beta-lactamase domain protein n=1 Tax=Alkaliphilus metalliredigens (strain QYMF) TaxID=293826 RepID=A6TQP1_ALKMQ|nr:MBL fold metallo-hydrolase [Alkaliphilus metalliredigens]ABR48509.1 beta-lactamase domain protein [Alkaliphilus metalliredigens QYMF]